MKKEIRPHLKQLIGRLLESPDFSASYHRLKEYPPIKVINALFPFLYSTDDQVRWNAITAMGMVISALADTDMESARVIMRRFMWNLNDESGGIGWGSPEAMGESLARHGQLAKEYANILLSFIWEDGNFQEHPLMQRGVLWGIARLAEEHPELIRPGIDYIIPFISSPDPVKRGLAARIIGLVCPEGMEKILGKLKDDETPFTAYLDGKLKKFTVKILAEKALQNCKETR